MWIQIRNAVATTVAIGLVVGGFTMFVQLVEVRATRFEAEDGRRLEQRLRREMVDELGRIDNKLDELRAFHMEGR